MQKYLDDCIELLRFSLSWAYDSRTRPLMLMIGILTFISIVVYLGLLLMRHPLLAILFLFPATVAYVYVALSVIHYALMKKGYRADEYGAMQFVNAIALGVFSFITVFLPWLDFKLLALNITLVIAFFVVIAISLMTRTGILMALLLPIVLLGLMSLLYSSLRLMFSVYPLFRGKGIVESLKGSWELTNGKLVMVFSRFYLTMCFISGASWAAVIPVWALVFAGLVVGAVALEALNISTLFGAAYVFLMMVASALAVPISLFMHAYLLTAVYSLLEPPQLQAPSAAKSPPVSRPSPKRGLKKERA